MEDLRLGRLLVSMQLVKENDLDRALDKSRQCRVPIGKMLVMTEQISDATMKTVVEAQWMIRDKFLTMEQATTAVGIAKRNGWTLVDAMIVMGHPAYTTHGTRLGELLIASEILSSEDIAHALQVANSSGLPLGRVLVLLDKLPDELLTLTLKLQNDLRMGLFDVSAAVDLLRKGKNRFTDVKRTGTRLGELLQAAGFINQTEIDAAVGMSQANHKLFGEVLVEFGWIQEETIEVAAMMQKQVRAHQLSINDAARVIKLVGADKMSVTDALTECGINSSPVERELRLYDSLRLIGYMTAPKLQTLIKQLLSDSALSDLVMTKAKKLGQEPKDLKEAIKLAIDDSAILADVLRETDQENKALIDCAQTVHSQVRAGLLKLDYALLRLALFQIGETTPTKARP
jgi:hypothetical protein